MYYVRYFLKCCIRNISRLICKPKILLILLVSLLILFLLNNYSHASYLGDDTYTDPNDNIINSYKTINIDFVNRMINTSNTTLVNYLKNYIKSGSSYYVYYGQSNGTSMLNGSPLDYRNLYVLIYDKNSIYSSTANYDNYQGLDCTVKMYNEPSGISFDSLYCFNGNTLSNVNLEDVYIPQNLLNYFDEYVVNYINDNTSSQNQQIIDKLEEQTSVQEDIKNEITSTDFDDSVVNIDSTVVENVDTNKVTGLFSTIFNNFNNLISTINFNEVEVISIGLPFVNRSIELRSDIISNALSGTILLNLINVAWYSLFGLYLFKFVTHIYSSIKSGEILNGFSFSDEVISSTML